MINPREVVQTVFKKVVMREDYTCTALLRILQAEILAAQKQAFKTAWFACCQHNNNGYDSLDQDMVLVQIMEERGIKG